VGDVLGLRPHEPSYQLEVTALSNGLRAEQPIWPSDFDKGLADGPTLPAMVTVSIHDGFSVMKILDELEMRRLVPHDKKVDVRIRARILQKGQPVAALYADREGHLSVNGKSYRIEGEPTNVMGDVLRQVFEEIQ